MNESNSLEFTGERYIPGTLGNIELEHLHRYLLAQSICKGKEVLDIASGEGYGSAILAEQAQHVIGVDISTEAVEHARKTYLAPNLDYRVGDCAAIPLPDHSVDVVVSFETIEHHTFHTEMISEIRRVLRPGGVLLISSPDKYHYTDKPGVVNEHHVKELYEDEFKALIDGNFRNTRYFGQRVVYGSLILSESTPADATSYWKEDGKLKTASGLSMPIFWLALASDETLPALPSGLFEQPIEESELVCLKQRDIDNAITLMQLKDQNLSTAANTLALKDAHLAQAGELLAQKDQHLKHAAEMLAQKDEHLAHAEEMLRAKDQTLADAAESLRIKDQLLQEANEWRYLFVLFQKKVAALLSGTPKNK
ncbi:class I SAM-dependent methyltransferase [Zoogloea sp.]|uniref:class I SAM-dependent methyltransferase n=1 Tax=Zoogloea sp. TaxID=49181 RepID=UPI002608CB45|nr:class I SAM-dependent methyltransferase [Zoogloea sp.]MDD3354507.1 methyltransferase domain-containing protein [Zoogloea sp.]